MLSYYLSISSSSFNSKTSSFLFPSLLPIPAQKQPKMGKSDGSIPRTSSTSRSSPSYTSQALALHNGMGGPHPSATQTVQPINVAGEITDMMPYRDNSPSRSTRGSGSRRRPLPESSHSSGSSSGSGSSGAATPLQYSPPASSGHAQAQGLHMGMAWGRPHHIQPVRLPALITGPPVWLELISVETSTADGGCSAIRGGKHAWLWTSASRVGIMWALRAIGALYLYLGNDMPYPVAMRPIIFYCMDTWVTHSACET